jgi:Iron-containing redox enzyme
VNALKTSSVHSEPAAPSFDPGLRYELFERHSDEFRHYLQLFAENPVFEDAHDHEVTIEDNPFRRPLRRHDIAAQDFTRRLDKGGLTSNLALSANRILLNIYESDLLFLPPANSECGWRDFARFYDPTSKVLGEIVRPVLEDHLFGFLEDEIQMSGPWSAQVLKDYLHSWHETCQSAPNEISKSILSASNPREAARFLLIQLAGDYLTEASAMARNVLGNYGEGLSELFKVLIDEYGNGVHEAKHSTLFESTLRSAGLHSGIHAYWQFYLPTSILLVNYFHYVSKNHSRYFRYLGALYNTEVSLIYATKVQTELLRTALGTDVDLRYFSEHSHIDRFHGEMAFDRLISPALARYGSSIIPEILRGFEEWRLLQEIADADLVSQIRFFDSISSIRPKAEALYGRIRSGAVEADLETFVEDLGERSTTHIHDDDRLLVIERGEMDFWPRHGNPMHLGPGAVLFIPRTRLHGSVVTTPQCVYHQPIVPPALAREFGSGEGTHS